MIGLILDGLFGCSHRRLTRPITPVSKPGVPSGDTYVVCLDCGKQYAYDWDHMRMGKTIERSPDAGVLHPGMPGTRKAKIKYALIGSALPLAILLTSGLVTKRRAKNRVRSQSLIGDALDQYIELPHGGAGARFLVRELIDHIEQSGRPYIINGGVDCAFADHPKPSSLDYWCREKFAKNRDAKQATNEVIAQLMATGLFEQADRLRCPDSRDMCTGLRLKPRVEKPPGKNPG
jgi:hypothetical protein